MRPCWRWALECGRPAVPHGLYGVLYASFSGTIVRQWNFYKTGRQFQHFCKLKPLGGGGSSTDSAALSEFRIQNNWKPILCSSGRRATRVAMIGNKSLVNTQQML